MRYIYVDELTKNDQLKEYAIKFLRRQNRFLDHSKVAVVNGFFVYEKVYENCGEVTG